MSEKRAEKAGVSSGKHGDYQIGDVHTASRRRSSVVNADVLAGDIFDERYETTQRGLKSRYVAIRHLWRDIAKKFGIDTRK